MKFWIKIVISLCVVLVIGVAIWAFVLRKPEDVQAYDSTSELIDYKESLGINEKLIDLRTMDYYNNDKAKKFGNSEDENNIKSIRTRVLSDIEIVEGESGVYVFDSYLTNQEYADDILEFLLPYLRGGNAKHSSLKTLKKNISSYIDALVIFNKAIDEVISYQKNLDTENDDNLKKLNLDYIYLRSTFKRELIEVSNVIISLIDFVDVSYFNNDLKMDTIFALSDAYARSVNVFAKADVATQETPFIIDSKTISKQLINFKNGENIYNPGAGVSEYDFLTSYNKLYNDYRSVLDYIFGCQNTKKLDISRGDSTALSEIKIEAQPHAQNVLKALGFRG